MEELSDATGVMEVDRTYSYGLDLIAQDRFDVGSSAWDAMFYLYDGHGNVRALADDAGTITDTYDYDAFGTLIEQLVLDLSASGLVPVTTDNRDLTTDNQYLYCGEQFDADLGLYFLRARYMDTDRGRFWSMDTWEGARLDPLSLHKYLYTKSDPANHVDPSGHCSSGTLVETVGATTLHQGLVTYIVYPSVHTAATKAAATIFLSVGFKVTFTAGAVGSLVYLADKAGLFDKARIRLRRDVRTRARDYCPSGQLLYYYRDRGRIAAIIGSGHLIASGRAGSGFPAGAYGSTIPPWSRSYTQVQIARGFFGPTRGSESVEYFVAFCRTARWRRLSATLMTGIAH